jgi:hypothetical protein
MIINSFDLSIYFNGLLVLVGKEKAVTLNEMALLKKMGQALRFDNDFIEKTIDNFLNNQNFMAAPPIFSDWSLAELFIYGITILITIHSIVQRSKLIGHKQFVLYNEKFETCLTYSNQMYFPNYII